MSPHDRSRGDAARQRAQALREAEAVAARRRRTAVVSATVAVLLVLAVVVGVAVQSGRDDTTSASPVPANLVDGGVLSGSATAPVTVTVYEDFQCPVCRRFEAQSGSTLAQLQQEGTVKVVSKPVAILDRTSPDRYSTRSLDAAACLVDRAPAAFPAFRDALFARQPEEGRPGLSDAVLAQLAREAGGPDISSCLSARTYEGWAARATDQASKDGLPGTPYVLVDGTPLQDTSPAGLRAAVQAAAR